MDLTVCPWFHEASWGLIHLVNDDPYFITGSVAKDRIKCKKICDPISFHSDDRLLWRCLIENRSNSTQWMMFWDIAYRFVGRRPPDSPSSPKDIQAWTVALTKQYGVLWPADLQPVWIEETDDDVGVDANWEVQVTPNHTYHLVNDPDNMPLTEAQFTIVNELLLKGLQQPAPYQHLWSNVRSRLDSSTFGPIPRDLESAHDHFDQLRSTRLPNWQNEYALVERKTDKLATQEMLNKNVAVGKRAIVDVYWRALDRQPGGNTDVHTICYTFDCASRTVSTRTALSEGTLERSEYRSAELSKKVAEGSSFPTFLASLTALGPGDSECPLLDTISHDPVSMIPPGQATRCWSTFPSRGAHHQRNAPLYFESRHERFCWPINEWGTQLQHKSCRWEWYRRFYNLPLQHSMCQW